MYRLTLASALLIASAGYATPDTELIGKPFHSKLNSNHVLSEERIVVYGRLEKEVITKPTETYGSFFGDGYCMNRRVSFKVEKYIQGNGPDLIEFSENVLNSCRALSADIGFGEAIMFLSTNKFRGVWSEHSARVYRLHEEAEILDPNDVERFTSFDNFEELLSTYCQPLEWRAEKDWQSYDTLGNLRERGILDFAVEKSKWPEQPQPRRDETHAYDEYYMVKMYKYIKLETLLALSSGNSIKPASGSSTRRRPNSSVRPHERKLEVCGNGH